MTDASEKFINDHRWELAQQYLGRANRSADLIRGLLFTTASAGIGLIIHDRQGTELLAHIAPLILLGLGAIVVFISWDIQKGKAIKRFEALRDGKSDYNEFADYSLLRNYVLDRTSGTLIALGAILEVSIRLCSK